jgi:hypothetical protein
MKLIYLVFLISINAFAATPSSTPSVTNSASGSPTANLNIAPLQLSGSGVNGMFTLFVGGSMIGGDYYPLYKGGSAYQVTSGKTAWCSNIKASSSTASESFQFISATASYTFGQSTALTGGVYQCGANSTYCNFTGTTSNLQGPVPGFYSFGSATYPGIQAGGTYTYTVSLDCYEQ